MPRGLTQLFDVKVTLVAVANPLLNLLIRFLTNLRLFSLDDGLSSLHESSP
jgi:hypothetical protein